MYRILSINPGSTSTKIALYDDEQEVFNKTLRHSEVELSQFDSIIDQADFRYQVVMDALAESDINIQKLSAVVGRGGLIKFIPGGTYAITPGLLADVRKSEKGEHASNLGAILAHDIASSLNLPSYIVDPVVVDEMEPIARISGHPEIERISIFHALNQKAVAHRYAKSVNKKYEDLNLIIAHLGGGISVGAHRKGKVIDVNNALNGDGPFSPERAGGLPVGDLAKLCFSGKYSEKEIKKMITGNGGYVSYLSTNDGRNVDEMVDQGDEYAGLIRDALGYQVAKEIGMCAAVLKGQVDQIILTGGLAHGKYLTDYISRRVEFIAPVSVYPGEDEMSALTDGALRILRGEEEVKNYDDY
ncbi:MAG: butyrate kinase [Tissierellia bacterium]|nr:butyrate kinase [Tissierellia bacterium]